MARHTDNRTLGSRPTVGQGKPLGRDRINQQLDKEQRDDIRALRTLPQWLRESSGLDGWLADEEKRLGMPSVRNGRGDNTERTA